MEKAADFLSDLYKRSVVDEKVQVLTQDLFLWRRQALALGRSEKHLTTIDEILDRAKESLDPVMEISIRDYGSLFQDRQAFINKAFESMTQQKRK